MVSFNGIPSNLRVPFMYVEINNTRAVAGPGSQPHKILVIGQMTADGSATAEVPVLVSNGQEIALFGEGSMLHHMLEALFANQESIEVWCIPLEDNGAGVAATGGWTFAGTATADGTLSLYLGGRLLSIAVSETDTSADVATAVKAAITADKQYGFSAGGAGSDVDLTYFHKGTLGNEVAIANTLLSEQALPAGITVTSETQMSGGLTNPVLTNLIAAMSDVWYNYIAFPYVQDSAAYTAMETELERRFGPLAMIDGIACGAIVDTLGNLSTYGAGKNSHYFTVKGKEASQTPSFVHAAVDAAVYAYNLNIDPARPLQTLLKTGVWAPLEADRFTATERNTLLHTGIATDYIDDGGLTRVERAIMTYQTNPLGVDDASYLNLNTKATLSYIRWDFRAYFSSKYPRHKLADDGTRFAAGQKVMTPKLGRAEAIARFSQWEENGLVEGLEQFKEDLIVERNTGDLDRLDFLMPPNLINQLRVAGVALEFLL